MDDLKKLIREVPGFPKPGILFYDITTLLKDKCGFRAVIDGLKHQYREAQADVVLGIEARGFIFAPALGLRPRRRVRPRAEAEQAAGGVRQRPLRAGVRHGLPRRCTRTPWPRAPAC